jgi:hypothetical protein
MFVGREEIILSAQGDGQGRRWTSSPILSRDLDAPSHD